MRHRKNPDQLDLTFVPGGIRTERGKFSTIIDRYVWNTTLDGCCEETGDVSYGWHYSKVDLGPEALRQFQEEAAIDGDRLTTEEEELISGSAGAIVSENDRGHVYITYYDDKRELDKAWEEAEEECAEQECEEDD